MLEIGHFIGGKNVAGTSGRTADVMQPMDGTVRGKVALASRDELRKAVENAKQAQIGWGATNPQRRVRVLMKFLELAQRDFEEMAELLAREHGKTIPDARGDIQRGVEVIEFACGVPHLMKGEYTESAGPGIDISVVSTGTGGPLSGTRDSNSRRLSAASSSSTSPVTPTSRRPAVNACRVGSSVLPSMTTARPPDIRRLVPSGSAGNSFGAARQAAIRIGIGNRRRRVGTATTEHGSAHRLDRVFVSHIS